jgi:tRNA pseudouridine55 synthase
MNGILIVDKAEGMTSHDVVQAVRKKFNAKAGHLGTLDPMATGVLPITLGKATRLAQFISNSPKIYEGEMRFGFSTDTYDREGMPDGPERPVEGDIAAAMRSLTVAIDQVPPPFSAKKVGGVPSHKLARKNLSVELAPSRVHVETFEVLELNLPLMRFRVVCGPGTYVRSLAHELGQRVRCGAHLTALRRTQSGEFREEHARPLETCSADSVIPLESLLGALPRIDVSEAEEARVLHGNEIAGDAAAPFARIFNKQGDFIAVGRVENGWVRPKLVLT